MSKTLLLLVLSAVPVNIPADVAKAHMLNPGRRLNGVESGDGYEVEFDGEKYQIDITEASEVDENAERAAAELKNPAPGKPAKVVKEKPAKKLTPAQQKADDKKAAAELKKKEKEGDSDLPPA